MPDIPSPDLDRDALIRAVENALSSMSPLTRPSLRLRSARAVDAILPTVTEAIRAAETRGRPIHGTTDCPRRHTPRRG